MPEYRVEVPEGPEAGIRVECAVHGESEEFHSHRRSVAFYCEGCGYELDLTLHDHLDWRELTERC